MMAREITHLGWNIGGRRNVMNTVKVTVSKPNEAVSDLIEIVVIKDNLRTRAEFPEMALRMCLDDFSVRYLKPVADRLFY